MKHTKRNAIWTQVAISKEDRDLLRKIAEKVDLPMNVVLKSAIHKIAREWNVDAHEEQNAPAT